MILNLALPNEVAEKLEEFARQQHTTVDAMTEHAVRKLLVEREKFERVMEKVLTEDAKLY